MIIVASVFLKFRNAPEIIGEFVMAKTDKEIAYALKEIIDKNGPEYLTDAPFQVFKELIASAGIDRKTAGAILHFLVSSLPGDVSSDSDFESLSGTIRKECGFNKKMADRIASIFLSLYSQDNKEEWKEKNREGLSQFLKEEFICTWEGFSIWDVGDGSVDCHYKAEIILSPGKAVSDDKKLVQLLEKNPFMKKEDIHDFFEKRLCKFLDHEFEEYCTAEDYYEPVVEDYEVEYDISEWSRKNGFEVISAEGSGYDDGYEPKFRRGWY